MSDIPHYFLYGQTQPGDEAEYLYIASLEESLPKHNWEISPHRHEHLHQLLVVEQGQVLVQVRDLKREESGPCILSVPPRRVHGFVHQPGVRGYILTISVSFLRQLFNATERQHFARLFSEPVLTRLNPDSRACWDFETTLRQMLHEYRQEQPCQSSVLGAYLKILLVLLWRQSHQGVPESSEASASYDPKISHYERFLTAWTAITASIGALPVTLTSSACRKAA
ncbi:MAG: AraC family ligand binding domain-containing protein [Thiolinea sp.]